MKDGPEKRRRDVYTSKVSVGPTYPSNSGETIEDEHKLHKTTQIVPRDSDTVKGFRGTI